MKLDISEKIKKIDIYMESVNELKNNQLVWQPFIKDLLLRLSWNSNSIEGNTLSLDETIAVIEYDEVRSGHTFHEYQEAKNMYRAIADKLNFEYQEVIGMEWIQEANAIIMQSEGGFRNENVYVGSLVEATYYPPSYEKVPEKMKQFVNELSHENERNSEEAIAYVAKKHIEFERIHPFKDGNGRTGRLLLNQQLLNYGLLPAIITDQSKYRQAFRRYERNEDTSLMEYVLADGILETCEKLQQIYSRFLEADLEE